MQSRVDLSGIVAGEIREWINGFLWHRQRAHHRPRLDIQHAFWFDDGLGLMLGMIHDFGRSSGGVYLNFDGNETFGRRDFFFGQRLRRQLGRQQLRRQQLRRQRECRWGFFH